MEDWKRQFIRKRQFQHSRIKAGDDALKQMRELLYGGSMPNVDNQRVVFMTLDEPKKHSWLLKPNDLKQDAALTSLYLVKAAFDHGLKPKHVTVTIEVTEWE